MSPFTACIVQTTSLPYDKQGNLDRALRAMEAAAARGASLILFPEMFLTGYLIRDQLAQLAEPYPNGPALTVLGQKAKALSLGVVMGMPLANPGGKPYNAVVMIDRDGTPAGFQAKTHFFGGEEKMFAPGTSLRAFDTSFGRMGILVCYDGEFPETARSLALDGAKLICMCAANMSPYEDYHFLYMRTRAMENRAYTLYCNYVGDEKRFHYCGQSGAFHPTGRILAEAGTQEETTLYALIDMEDTTATPSLAMPPIKASILQGLTRSLSCPTPDQPKKALPSSWATKLPLAVWMSQTARESSRPACSMYSPRVLPPSSMAKVA